jgi:hypothetical protein
MQGPVLKNFYGRNLSYVLSKVFALVSHFDPSLIFAGMAGAFMSGAQYSTKMAANQY